MDKKFGIYQVINEKGLQFQVIEVRDEEGNRLPEEKQFCWSRAGSVRGAVTDALRCGIMMRDIDTRAYGKELKGFSIRRALRG